MPGRGSAAALVARSGLRSIEAARLQLDDLDWRAGRTILCGKASREDGMPLPADGGQALSAYLRQARPATGEPPQVSAAVPVRGASTCPWQRMVRS